MKTLILLAGLLVGLIAPALSDAQQPLVGVIRFDTWPGNGTAVADRKVRFLDPNQWHYRIPFFGSETGFNSVTMNENAQSVIDQELAYSAAAGIKFWCFNHQITEMHGGIDGYRNSTSPNKPLVKVCTQEGALNSGRINDTIAFMNAERNNWLTVLGGRPVFFLQTFFGLITATDTANLRNAVTANGFPNPYLICQGNDAGGAVIWMNTVGCDAISGYAMGLSGVGQGNPYSNLVTATQADWEGYKSTGRPMVPTVMTGWDPRPDADLAACGACVNGWVTEGTPAQIAAHVQAALNFVAANPSAHPANLIQIYAWNEISEGGWLLPSNPALNAVGTGRLDAIRAVLGTQSIRPPAAPTTLQVR